ncbi:putative trans-zeatin O-beta-D-glucosyltransferase [Helianthus annuus]|nr:putative trans-zeatin O-beta-D-glucosyltransferase [Helianthus annuus]
MALEQNQLHFLVIPMAAPGHYIPTIDLAKLLAQHGVRVTMVTTPVNALRFGSILDQEIQSGLPICFLEFPFSYKEFGLPEGCESVDDLPNMEMTRALMQAYSSLQTKVEQYIENLVPRPNCILADTFLLWPGETAKKFKIPRIIFDGMNCFTQMCNHVLHVSKVYESVGESDSESFVLPGLPDCIELKRTQLPFSFDPRLKGISDFNEKLRVSESEAYGVVVNSFEELEQKYVDEYQKVKGDNVWCIGPLSLCHKDESEKFQRGNKSSVDKNDCLMWLDSQENGSVIYACLGSVSRVDPAQLIELALALESSKRPFIWVVRAGHKTENIEKWIEEQEFEKRTKDRALLIHGWAPQLLVLSHPAIGGFLTHCGWNSTLEGVCAGVPMVTWPQFQEQFYNEKLVVQVLRTGVSVGAQKTSAFWLVEDESGELVKSDAFHNAIEMVMEEGKEGEDRRKRAKELGKMANKAIEEGGSSHRNMTRLIEAIKNQERTMKLS